MFRTFKRVFALLATLALLAGTFALSGSKAAAQSNSTAVPGVWASAILIQNVGTASLTSGSYSIQFYNASGSQVKDFSPTDTIASGDSKEFFIPAAVSDLASGQYSVVVSSSQPVKAVVNTSTSDGGAAPWSAFAYEGFGSGDIATKLYFPGFYKNYYSFYAELVIQNAGGSSAADVQATFYDGTTGQQVGNPISLGSLPANASKTFAANQSIFSSLPEGNQNGKYGVVVESTNGVSLAGVANIWRGDTSGVASYSAFTAGSTTAYAAALYKNYYNFVSSLTIQNLDESNDAQGTITYSNGETENFDISSNASQEFYLPGNGDLPEGPSGNFSAKVVATSGSIVVLVNIERKQSDNPAFGSYNAAGEAANSVNLPAIFSDYYNFFTGVTIQNAGTASTNITLRYADGRSSTFNNVPANGTKNILHLPGNSDNILAAGTQTGGTISADQPLVVIVQHNTDPNLSSYASSKTPNDFLFVTSGAPGTTNN